MIASTTYDCFRSMERERERRMAESIELNSSVWGGFCIAVTHISMQHMGASIIIERGGWLNDAQAGKPESQKAG